MKFVEKEYLNKIEILKFPNHHVQMAVTVDDVGVTANADGKKIVKAGTIVGGGVLDNETNKVSAKNTAEAEGVLLDDVDVTYGPASGAMVIHGFIKTGALPVVPSAEAKTALTQIHFVK